MMVRRMTLASIVLAVLATSAGHALADEIIARFKGIQEGKTQTVIGVEQMGTGKLIPVPIPNVDAVKKGDPPTPKKDLLTAAKALKPGDIVKLGIETSPKTGPTLISIEPYEVKPGEETPNGYVFKNTFDKPSGKMTSTLLVLTKFGKEYQFTIPTHKAENGAMEEDKDIMASIGKLQQGNAVWAQVQGKQIMAIEPYTDPKVGKFVKVTKTEVNGKDVPSAEVEDDGGKTVTLLVPGKDNGKSFVPDALVNGALHNKVRPGAMIEYRVHEDGDKLWLREIAPAPKAAKTADKDKEMAKEAPKKK